MKHLLRGKRIGVFGKGGAGKSTVTVLLARAFAERGYSVVVIDADSTNEGMHRAFGADVAPRSLLDHYGGMIFSGGAVTCPVDDPTPLPGAELSLQELDPEFFIRNEQGIVVLSAGKVSGLGAGAGCDGPVSKIVRDVRITGTGHDPVTLIDFKAGFEDIARGVITGVDIALVVVDPSVAAVSLAVRMKRTVELLKVGQRPATSHLTDPRLVEIANRIFEESSVRQLYAILNRVRGRPAEAHLRQELLKEGIEPIGVIPQDDAIADAWLQGESLPPTWKASGDVIASLEKNSMPQTESNTLHSPISIARGKKP